MSVSFLDGLTSAAQKLLFNEGDSEKGLNWRNILALGGGIASVAASRNKAPVQIGYQGGIPQLAAARAPVANAYDPNRRPGSGGMRYMSDVAYSPRTDPGQAQGIAATQAAQLADRNTNNLFNQQRPAASTLLTPQVQDKVYAWAIQNNYDPAAVWQNVQQKYAAGQIPGMATLDALGAKNTQTMMAGGGAVPVKKSLYLGGPTDGMADKLPARIDGTQEAALSHGEFVVPADVVSHLGNGNSDAGAQVLYGMMDRIRKARTGRAEQAPRINPTKVIPA